MDEIIRLIGSERAVEFLGVRLVGINAVNGMKLLLSFGFVLLVLILKRIFGSLARILLKSRGGERVRFWTRQAGGLITAVLIVLGLASIWFNDPGRLAASIGIFTAALAISLQRVITAVAAYFIILRGKIFSVGDRIVMGGVRGDVVRLRLTQTTIMEMGQPPTVEPNADPAMWVRSRQYTGRMVAVSNARIFDEPIYNYSREFPFIWEEIRIPIRYGSDRGRAETILLEATRRHTKKIGELGQETLREMERRYFLKPNEMGPRVYYRLTDNWLELTVRFLVEDRGMREIKDAISRDILSGLDAARLPVASQTFEVVSARKLSIEITGDREKSGDQ